MRSVSARPAAIGNPPEARHGKRAEARNAATAHQHPMATITNTTSKPTLTRRRNRLAAPQGSAGGRISRSPAQAKRDAAKLHEFREDLKRRRTPDDATVRSSLLGGRLNE